MKKIDTFNRETRSHEGLRFVSLLGVHDGGSFVLKNLLVDGLVRVVGAVDQLLGHSECIT